MRHFQLCRSLIAWTLPQSALLMQLKQASHWHDMGFTPCQAIWRATVPIRDELVIVRVEMRGDAG